MTEKREIAFWFSNLPPLTPALRVGKYVGDKIPQKETRLWLTGIKARLKLVKNPLLPKIV